MFWLSLRNFGRTSWIRLDEAFLSDLTELEPSCELIPTCEPAFLLRRLWRSGFSVPELLLEAVELVGGELQVRGGLDCLRRPVSTPNKLETCACYCCYWCIAMRFGMLFKESCVPADWFYAKLREFNKGARGLEGWDAFIRGLVWLCWVIPDNYCWRMSWWFYAWTCSNLRFSIAFSSIFW